MSNQSELDQLRQIEAEVVDCRLCPRLVQWRESVAASKRRSYEDETYWGRPVPGFGDLAAERLILGLAPAAHGANRTGRMFTGDRSGDWLYRALHRAGAASQAESLNLNDGLTLKGVWISAVCRCAPPGNKPLPSEISNCQRYLKATLANRAWKSVLCLGGIAWVEVHRTLCAKQTPFGHGRVRELETGMRIVGSYHPSQQNTFTGRLTESMLDDAVRLFLDTPQDDAKS